MWLSAIVVEAPAATAVSRAQVKEFLRLDVDDTAFDTEVDGWIAGVIDTAEAITGTRLVTQTVQLQADSFADLARLPIAPVQSIDSITYRDTAGVEQTLDADRYELFGAGLIFGVRAAAGSGWPVGWTGRGGVTVTATVGYGDAPTDIPPAITIALLRTIRGHFDDKYVDLPGMLVNHRIWL